MEVEYKTTKINIPESWDDITFKQYLDYAKVSNDISKLPDDSIEKVLAGYKVIEILTNTTEEELDRLQVDEINDLSDKLGVMLQKFNFENAPADHFDIDGVTYAAKNISELDNGEYISLNILREQHKNEYDLFPKMLAILIRPAVIIEDLEAGITRYELEPFSRRDIQNMELRADKFLTAKAKDLVPILNFFLTMIKG